MTTDRMPAAAHGAGAFFDDYVTRVFPARRTAQDADWQWPGDEWIDGPRREATFRAMLPGLAPGGIRRAVEIGPGSGKYTAMLLERTDAAVHAFEISGAFIDALTARCPAAARAGRLTAHRLSSPDNRFLLDATAELGEQDLLFGIDVFLMMDWQSVVVYLVSAAAVLRRGGRFFGTFGDALSPSGWARVLRDAGRHSAVDQSPSTRFHWVTPELVETTLARLGFADIEIARGPEGGLDVARLYVGATLARPLARAEAARMLAPAGDSTNRSAW